MKQSVLVLYIVIGNAGENPDMFQEVPQLGLFSVYNVIKQYNQWVLAYSTDQIRGRDADKIRYAQGFLPVDGIGAINENADFRLGGGTVLQSPTRFKLKNTAELKARLDEYNVLIAGRQVYVVEYSWDEPNNPAMINNQEIDVNPIFAGRADSVTWGEAILGFQAVPTFEAQRASNLSIDEFPVTFGSLLYGFNKRAEKPESIPMWVFTGSEAEKKEYLYPVVNYAVSGGDIPSYTGQIYQIVTVDLYSAATNMSSLAGRMNEFKMFFSPVSALPHEPYYSDTTSSGGDCYLVNEDNGEGVPILTQRVAPWNPSEQIYSYHLLVGLAPVELRRMAITIARPFENGIPRRVRIVRADVCFQGDGWSSRNTTNENITNERNVAMSRIGGGRMLPLYWQWDTNTIYHYNYLRDLAQNYYEKYQTSNTTDISKPDRYAIFGLGELLDADIGSVMSRFGYAGSAPELFVGSMRRWELEQGEYNGYSFIAPGIFRYANTPAQPNLPTASLIDRVVHTELGAYAEDAYIVAVRATVPARDPSQIAGDRAYLAIRTYVRCLRYDDPPVQRLLIIPNSVRRATEIIKVSEVLNPTYGRYAILQDINFLPYPIGQALFVINGQYGIYDAFHPSIIAETLATNLPTDSNDLDGLFWYNPGDIIIGHHKFPISDLNMESNAESEILMTIKIPTGDIDLAEFHDIGIIYEDDVDISAGVHLQTRGRILLKGLPKRISGQSRQPNNRAQLNNPVSIIEHAMRLSNWSETGTVAADITYNKWGKEYVPSGYSELIDTDGFDSPALNGQRATKISGQIINPSEAGNYAIAKALCKDFYIGMNDRLPKDYSLSGQPARAWFGTLTMPHVNVFSIDTPADINSVQVIDLSHLQDEVEIEEPSAYDIYCEPIIKYNYVEGLGYTQEMAVTNINMPAYLPEYTRGLNTEPRVFSGKSDSEAVWETCKKIFNKYKSFAEMPQGLIGQRWIGDNGEAWEYNTESYETALKKLKNILWWMQRRRTSITVPWEVGREWSVGAHIKLSVPHVLQGEPLLCVIETVKKSRYANQVSCGLIFIESPVVENTFVIDETGNAGMVIDESGNRNAIIVEHLSGGDA